MFAHIAARYDTRGATLPSHFLTNFWNDWVTLLPRGSPITSLDGCDFSGLLLAAKKQAQRKKERKNERTTDTHRPVVVAIVDGEPQPVCGGGTVEAGSVFMGHGGMHPMAGRIKHRVRATDVTLNLGEGAKVPPGAWAAIVHDPFVDWLACWRDPLLGVVKYVRLSPAAESEQSTTKAKFDRARAFHAALSGIVARNVQPDLVSVDDPKRRQLATCFWLLVRTALRVGTHSHTNVVGLTTLTTGHVRLLNNGNLLSFDFLGKDNVLFRRSVVIDNPDVLRNLRELLRPARAPAHPVFRLVSSTDLNEYLGRMMRGLTAKDVRTAMASAEFEAAIERMYGRRRQGPWVDGPNWAALALLVANIRVAFLCNHRTLTRDIDRYADSTLAEEIDELEASVVHRVSDPKVLTRRARTMVRQGHLALGTSRANYIDPRITVSFAARAGMPAGLALPGASLSAKFAWAADEGHEFRWRHTQASGRS